MRMNVIVCISPFNDVAVVVGPFRSRMALLVAHDDLVAKGWNTEICPLDKADDVPAVSNEE